MSILPVVSISGCLASKEIKMESKDRSKTTLQSMLGAFLVTKDSIDNDGNGKPKTGVKKAAKKNVPSEYAMFALAKNDQIMCISCGYPTLRGFAPEKHRRFDRMLTCSLGCFYNRAHYKEMDELSLKTKMMKRITDAIQAASAQ